MAKIMKHLALLHDYKAKTNKQTNKPTSENTKGKKDVGISW